MDPLDTGDAGALGSVFDTITGTVNSIEEFGSTVGRVGTFQMGQAMIWAVIGFMFLALLSRLATPWNSAAAERWRQTGQVRPPAAPYRPRKQDPREDRILELEDKLAAALATIAALTAGEAPPSREANDA
jgi:hypothetical protein